MSLKLQHDNTPVSSALTQFSLSSSVACILNIQKEVPWICTNFTAVLSLLNFHTKGHTGRRSLWSSSYFSQEIWVRCTQLLSWPLAASTGVNKLLPLGFGSKGFFAPHVHQFRCFVLAIDLMVWSALSSFSLPSPLSSLSASYPPAFLLCIPPFF